VDRKIRTQVSWLPSMDGYRLNFFPPPFLAPSTTFEELDFSPLSWEIRLGPEDLLDWWVVGWVDG